MISILIVDDSETEIAILKNIFQKENDFHVVGTAKNGEEAVQLVALLKPDVITMDIQMPIMDGFIATQRIMSTYPTPIVIISSQLNDDSLNATYRALEAGALSVISKPFNITSPTFLQDQKRIIDIVRSMSEIKVIKQRFAKKELTTPIKLPATEQIQMPREIKIIAIGASVGGPQALKLILSKLPANFPVPIVVVQHMTPGFINGFAKWLNDVIPLHCKVAENFESLKAGTVYFAADGCHLEIMSADHVYLANLVKGSEVAGFCPSITKTFTSIAAIAKHHALGILLTGMGHDGAEGLLSLKKAKAHTIIQDEKSCVVFGMASVAASLHAHDTVVELAKMADYLLQKTMNVS